MHKTEGADNASNRFSNGPPGTVVEENWLNAVQDEIRNVIEAAGLSLLTADTETGDQMIAALRLLAVPTVTIYTANDTWTKPTGLVAVEVIVVGGGGGGGGVDGQGAGNWAIGGGGGGGGFSKKWILAASLNATETVTVGAGGTAGAGAGGGSGGTGGTSSFGAHCQATGGAGGGGDIAGINQITTGPGNGGLGSGGDFNTRGAPGVLGVGLSNNNGRCRSGNGGSTIYGGGARGVSGQSAGETGKSYGGGGSGAAVYELSTNYAGGAGADGVVIVRGIY